jgi:mannosyltransferase
MSEKVKGLRIPSVSSSIWLVLIILLATTVRLYRLGYQSLWYDEAFSWAVGGAPLKIALAAILTDGGNPPLYQYFVLHPLFYLGQSEEIIRLPSAVFGILAIPLIYKVGHLCFGQKVGLVSALWLSLSPLHVWYSQEARMYAMVVFLSLGSVYFFLRTLRENDWKLWLGFVVLTALAYPTNYSAFLVSLMQLAFIICTFRTNYRVLHRWTISQILAFLPTVPWLVALLRREVKSFGFGWIPRPGPLDPLKTLWNFSLGYTGILTPLISLSLLVFTFAFLHGLWNQRSGSEGDPPQVPLVSYAKLFLALWLILPIAFVFLISQLLVPIYIDRFLLVALPPYLILVAYGLLRIRNVIARRGLILALTLAISLSLGRIYFDPIYSKEDWRGLARYIAQQSQSNDVIFVRTLEGTLPLNYYYRGQLGKVAMSTNRITAPLNEIAQEYDRVWLVYPYPHDTTHFVAKPAPLDLYGGEIEPEIRDWLVTHRHDVVEERNFSGMQLILYDLSP